MIGKLTSYLRFIIKSTNQHGVHSPFVYDLVTKCFYDRQKKEWDVSLEEFLKQNDCTISRKHSAILLRLLYFLEIEKVLIPKNSDHDATDLLFKINDKVTIYDDLHHEKSYDLIYINSIIKKSNNYFSKILTTVHNNSVLIIRQPHFHKRTKNLWQSLIHTPEARVTIDTYHFGFVFFRKEQVKEHFTVRL